MLYTFFCKLLFLFSINKLFLSNFRFLLLLSSSIRFIRSLLFIWWFLPKFDCVVSVMIYIAGCGAVVFGFHALIIMAGLLYDRRASGSGNLFTSDLRGIGVGVINRLWQEPPNVFVTDENI